MHTGRTLWGSMLTVAVLAACGDAPQPTGPVATPGPSAAPRLSMVGPQRFVEIRIPDSAYVASTNLIDISGIADFTTVTSVTDGTQTVTFSAPLEKRSVPGSWPTWEDLPFVETSTPHVLYSQGATTIEMTLAEPVSTFGFELGTELGLASQTTTTCTARYYFRTAPRRLGTLVYEKSATFGVNDPKVHLWAISARSSPGVPGISFNHVIVTCSHWFVIAQPRYRPGMRTISLEAVYSGLPYRDPNQIHLADPNVFVEILDVRQFLPSTGSSGDVRIGPDFASGTSAQDFTLLDINNDGVLDVRLRFSTQALINNGHLGPNTTQLVVWGRDPSTGQGYRGEAEVTIIGGPGGDPRTLSTAPANNGSGGVFMNLTLTRLVHATSFDSPIQGTEGTVADVEVWTRPGSYVGFDGSSAGWTLTQTVQATRMGNNVNAPIVLSSPLVLQPNQTTAVYLQVVSAGGGLRYTGTAASPPQTTWSNADLTLFSDVARVTAVPFAGNRFTPRTFSGNVNYLIFP